MPRPPGRGRTVPQSRAPSGSVTGMPSGQCQARPTNLILLPPLSGDLWYTPKVSSEIRTLSRARTARLLQPTFEAIRLHEIKSPIPSGRVVVGEIDVQRRDPGLDRPPERPADVRHEGKEVHPGQLLRVRPAEVGLAEHGPQVIIKARLLGGVAQVEARIVVPTQLVIDDSKPATVVDEVIAEQVVVTGDYGESANIERTI